MHDILERTLEELPRETVSFVPKKERIGKMTSGTSSTAPGDDTSAAPVRACFTFLRRITSSASRCQEEIIPRPNFMAAIWRAWGGED